MTSNRIMISARTQTTTRAEHPERTFQ